MIEEEQSHLFLVHYPKSRRSTIGGQRRQPPVPSLVSQEASSPRCEELFDVAKVESKREESSIRLPSMVDHPRKRNLGQRRRVDAILILALAADYVEEQDLKRRGRLKRKAGRLVADTDRQHKKRKKGDDVRRTNIPVWVLETFRGMGATDEHLKVMSKVLAGSDTDKGQNRLLLPREAVMQSSVLKALREEETRRTKLEGLSVVVVNRDGGEFKLILKYLDSINAHRIMGPNYQDFVAANKLNDHLKDTIYLCVLHVPAEREGEQQQLRLGIVKNWEEQQV